MHCIILSSDLFSLVRLKIHIIEYYIVYIYDSTVYAMIVIL